PARLWQPGEEARAELGLPRGDGLPADRADVRDGGDEAGEQLVRQRARLEAVAERLVRGGPHLVGPPRLEQLPPPEGEAEVRPEELVRRADEDVDAPGGDVDRPVRPVMDGV